MLGDKELDQTAAKLAAFQAAKDQHNAALTEVLEKYATLLQDYKRLKSDFEEERDARERYKQMAKAQERSPFVLLLIDGDGYIFDDDLVSNGNEGGQRAARLLNDVMINSLRSRGLDHCKIMVRVYANLAGLSKTLSEAKLAGPEKRSLARFTASFTCSNDLFDFVDAGELKENADFKIRAMFRQFVENAQCRHIYFAACHDVGYISELTPYAGQWDRITLVRTPAFHHKFGKLGMRVEALPNIFRTMPLEGQPAVSQIKTIPSQPPTAETADSSSNVCAFFQKGMCKYGKSCRFLHVKANANGSSLPTTNRGSLHDIKSRRQDSSEEKPSVPFGMPNLMKSDNDFMSGHVDPLQTQIDFATMLPQEDKIPRNQIAVNKHEQRLDPYIQPTSAEEKSAFYARIGIQKLCNNYHLLGHCPNQESCEYDHSPASPAIINCLKHIARNNPCPRQGGCRLLKCVNGHVCQKAECKYRGGKIKCKFGPSPHTQDIDFADYVQGIPPKETMDGFEPTGSVSGKGSTPSMPEARSMANESDGEREDEEGALLDLGDDASLD